jgi:membrane fusion protein (multidrug efflux system)
MNSTAEPTRSSAPQSADGNGPARHVDTTPPKIRRRSPVRTALAAIVVLAMVGWGAHFALHAYRYQSTDDAYIVGHLHTVSAQIDGQVSELLVRDNQEVHAGYVLLRIDPLPFQLAVEKAKAALAQARAREHQLTAAASQAQAALAEAQARVQQSQAQVAQTKAQLELADVTLARNEQLVKENGAARAELDQARSAAQAAEAAHRGAEANLVAAEASVRSAEAAQVANQAEIEAARAAVAAADAAQHDAERELSYTTVRAPSDGRVGNRHVEVGNRVQAGQALLALAEPDAWVVANFKETQIARMHAGQEVELEVDALPGQTLHGRIDSFAPASGAQFALLPPDNATGNFNKVVQRVPVKITFNEESRRQLGDRLRLGLSVVVDVRVR